MQQFSDIKENLENLPNFKENELYMAINGSIIEEQKYINKIQEEYDQSIEDTNEFEIQIEDEKADKSNIENLIDKKKVELNLIEDEAQIRKCEKLLNEYVITHKKIENNRN